MSRRKRYMLFAVAVLGAFSVLGFASVCLASHGEAGSYRLFDANGNAGKSGAIVTA